jgi:hypothetical protein
MHWRSTTVLYDLAPACQCRHSSQACYRKVHSKWSTSDEAAHEKRTKTDNFLVTVGDELVKHQI